MIPLLGSEGWDRFIEDIPSSPSINPCPRCSWPMGDGDRVTKGICGRCQIIARRLR